MKTQINWGIIATGGIARKFAEDFRFVENGTLLAVASRSQDKAQHFANDFHIERAYGSYEALAEDPDVDAVYVATPHDTHVELSKMCLEKGKAVLCEKPMAVNAAQLESLLDTAEKSGTFLMEAMWTYFMPVVRQAKKWVNDGRIGNIKMIQADFGFKTPDNPKDRLYNPALAGGALLDIGIYPLAIAHYFAPGEIADIKASAIKADTGVDQTLGLVLTYDDDIIANLTASFRFQMENAAYVYGDEGYVKIHGNFWHPHKAVLMKDSGIEDIVEDDRLSTGYDYETNAMTQWLLEGKKESPVVPFSWSRKSVETMDKIRELIGVKYPFE